VCSNQLLCELGLGARVCVFSQVFPRPFTAVVFSAQPAGHFASFSSTALDRFFAILQGHCRMCVRWLFGPRSQADSNPFHVKTLEYPRELPNNSPTFSTMQSTDVRRSCWRVHQVLKENSPSSRNCCFFGARIAKQDAGHPKTTFAPNKTRRAPEEPMGTPVVSERGPTLGPRSLFFLWSARRSARAFAEYLLPGRSGVKTPTCMPSNKRSVGYIRGTRPRLVIFPPFFRRGSFMR